MAESGQQGAPVAPVQPYAVTVDRVLDAPLIVDATIRSAVRIKGAEAAGVRTNHTRFYVEADLAALIRGPGAVPPRLGWLVDVPNDARGRPPQLKRQRVIAFARPVAGRPSQIQLIAPDSQIAWTPGDDAQIKRVVRDILSPDAPPAITGIGNAFHVPGSLPGEGETQIFLQTESGDPVSILVLRRPGEQRRWAVALGEIVDEAAGPPERDTLLWYRLACGLPRTLPESATANEEPGRAALAAEDYTYVLRALGSCDSAEPAT
ncbi:hypothetical protein [Sphingomonas sp.]|uniref:hypothetical protein n=1 Tax=Sphingomonas sp. TaxID=28214 RepID=UPI002C2088E1|nr:hypothetical protein [Sphingomonas sp.]HTG38318.1 hypothetical protein [Sphingomonas sp.]